VSRQSRLFLLQLAKRTLEGDDAAASASLVVIEEARQRQGAGQCPMSHLLRFTDDSIDATALAWFGHQVEAELLADDPSQKAAYRKIAQRIPSECCS